MGKLVISALTGPVKGQVFDLKNGLTLGREFGDILLKDPAVSNLHAEIKVYATGKIMIVDKDSKNKIYVNNKRTVKSVLEENSKFKIGESEFILKNVKTPEEILTQFLSSFKEKVEDKPSNLKSFSQPVRVKFSSGIQEGREYKLYYGPRFFGPQSVDCPVFDKKSPEKCFALVPKGQNILFKTSYPELVQYNKKQIEKTKVKTGDQIFIGESVLDIKLG